MIYFDIDGVARRLDLAAYGHEVDRWATKNSDGLTLMDIVNRDPTICARAPPSEYLPFINSLREVEFLSNQPPRWQEHTDTWLREHMEIPYKVHYTKGPDAKLDRLHKGDLLVDDYPFFYNYRRIILVDMPYNRDTKCPVRVTSEQELREALCTN
jgi:hypothetical protein